MVSPEKVALEVVETFVKVNLKGAGEVAISVKVCLKCMSAGTFRRIGGLRLEINARDAQIGL